ncbi:zinc-binding dehydrogenase [Candidatus Woesearchaeota archaeon]|nr:zinc-binding dehydrogenase [Candidatus Woesearchaeota archaeon]
MKATLLYKPSNVKVLDVNNFKEEGILKVNLAGICGTDTHVYNGALVRDYPIVMGHEIVGTVISDPQKMGLISDQKLSKGDRVVVVPGINCEECYYCRTFAQYCGDRKFYGLNLLFNEKEGEIYGGFSQYMNLLPRTRVIKVSDMLSDKEAVMIEVLASALRAVQRGYSHGDLPTKTKAAVIGVGPIGLSAVAMLYTGGADVLAIDRIPKRLEKAKEFGVSKTVDVGNLNQDELESIILEHTAGVGMDFVIECAGEPAAFNDALSIVRRGGRIVEMGNFAYAGNAQVDLTKICQRDIEIIGSAETLYRDFITAQRIIESSGLNFGSLTTNIVPLEDLSQGIRDVISRKGIKTAVNPNE